MQDSCENHVDKSDLMANTDSDSKYKKKQNYTTVLVSVF